MLFPQSFIRVWFFWESRLQQCTWWLQVLWKFCENFEILNFRNVFFFYFRILKFYEILWKLKFLEFFWKFWNFLTFLKFWDFLKISEFSLIDDEVQVFRINIKLLSNPVAELKISENDSHCQAIVLKTMDRSIVKQLEKEKNSNFNVENFVGMFIDWGTIIVNVLSCIQMWTNIFYIRMKNCILWENVIFENDLSYKTMFLMYQ